MATSRNKTIDPYEVLGVPADAASSQIKATYRKLALRYHPDRRRRQHQHQQQQDNIDDSKFAEIAEAYAILSDPVKKREYDHLRRYGAFDNNNNDSGGGGSGNYYNYNSTTTNTRPQPTSQRYAEDYSGGYYKPGYVPPPQTTAHSSIFAKFSAASTTARNTAAKSSPHPYQQQQQQQCRGDGRGRSYGNVSGLQVLQSQDSFFDDLLYYNLSVSPTSGAAAAAASSSSPASPTAAGRNEFSHVDDERNPTSSSASASPTASRCKNNTDGTSSSSGQQHQPSHQHQHPHQQEQPTPIKQRPGIGFSIPPLGKHLSIHVPSRSEILLSVMMMQQQQQQQEQSNSKGRQHKQRNQHNLFGTRVTYSSQQPVRTAATATTTRNGDNASRGWWTEKLDQALLLGACGAESNNHTDSDDFCIPNTSASSTASTNTSKPITIMSSTTTRIAKGKRRCVTRTAHVHPDGTREIVVEEDGVVKVRKFYSAATKCDKVEEEDEEEMVGNDGGKTEEEGCTEKVKKNVQQHENGILENEATSNKGTNGEKVAEGNGDDGGGIQKEGKFTFLGLFKSCLAPACTCLPSS